MANIYAYANFGNLNSAIRDLEEYYPRLTNSPMVPMIEGFKNLRALYMKLYRIGKTTPIQPNKSLVEILRENELLDDFRSNEELYILCISSFNDNYKNMEKTLGLGKGGSNPLLGLKLNLATFSSFLDKEL